jgi:hypothetical protein
MFMQNFNTIGSGEKLKVSIPRQLIEYLVRLAFVDEGFYGLKIRSLLGRFVCKNLAVS